MNIANACIALALGLYAVSLLSNSPERIFPGHAPVSSKTQILGGIIHHPTERDFLLCAQGKCLRVSAKVPKNWETKWAWVEGTLAGNLFLPKEKDSVDPVG